MCSFDFDKAIEIVFNLAEQRRQNTKSIVGANRCVRNYENQINSTVVEEIIDEIRYLFLDALRVNRIEINLFAGDSLSNLVLMSGGNYATLYKFLYEIFGRIEQFSVTQKDVNRAVSEARATF